MDRPEGPSQSYIKHFAANDQETNRTAFLLTYMTEQTFRETCLKPFEMVVKNFDFERYVMATDSMAAVCQPPVLMRVVMSSMLI